MNEDNQINEDGADENYAQANLVSMPQLINTNIVDFNLGTEEQAAGQEEQEQAQEEPVEERDSQGDLAMDDDQGDVSIENQEHQDNPDSNTHII